MEDMNFPERQRTGRMAELKVEELFTSWFWTVGKDLIDTGYDFMVEPDIDLFRGHRFLVQVKGTARAKKGSVVAPVAKSRLRQYANNPLPVFLIRSTAEGVLHWHHVQRWALQNRGRLSGNGDAGVLMPAQQTLDNKTTFSAYLADVFLQTGKIQPTLVSMAQEQSVTLSAIDPNFDVEVGVLNGVQSYEIHAKTKQAQFALKMRVSGSNANKASLRDAIDYGLPASIDVDSLQLTGSPLWAAIGANSFSKGTVDLSSTSTKVVTVVLYPGPTYSLIANRYQMASKLYVGREGFAVVSEDRSGALYFELRSKFTSDASARADITLGFRLGVLQSTPIRFLDDLAPLGVWAKQTIDQESIYVEVNTSRGRLPISTSLREATDILAILHHAYVLGIVHQVAKVLCSDFLLEDGDILDQEEASNLFLAFALLRGERRKVGVNRVDIETKSPAQVIPHSRFRITTELELTVGGRLLGNIPVALDLKDYAFVVADTGQCSLVKDSDSDALIYYCADGIVNAQEPSAQPSEP